MSDKVEPTTTSFKGYLHNLPQTGRKVLGNLLDLEESKLILLIKSIIQHQFVLGSDGSVNSEQTSYTTRIQSTINLHHFINSLLLCTTKSSFRAKGLGYHSCLYLLRAFMHYYNLLPSTAKAIKVYMDNKGLLQGLSYGFPHSIKYIIIKDADLVRKFSMLKTQLRSISIETMSN